MKLRMDVRAGGFDGEGELLGGFVVWVGWQVVLEICS